MEDQDLVDDVGGNDARAIFAVCYVQGKIGLACFDEVTNEIMTDAVAVGLDDIEDLFTKLKMLTKPSVFVVHPMFVANQGNFYETNASNSLSLRPYHNLLSR